MSCNGYQEHIVSKNKKIDPVGNKVAEDDKQIKELELEVEQLGYEIAKLEYNYSLINQLLKCLNEKKRAIILYK